MLHSDPFAGPPAMRIAPSEADHCRVTIRPLDDSRHGEGLFTETLQRRLIVAFLILGLTARVLRYLLRFPLWDDEALFLANFVGASYGDLLGGLHYCQVAPIGFLWLELTLSKLLGFNEYALRLPSLVCGIAGLFLFKHVAERLVRGPALVFAVAMYAVSYPMIRYSAEAKPYGIDLFFSLALLALVVEWWHGGMRQSRWLWIAAALIGPMMLFSYPTVFVAAALSAWLALMLLRRSWPLRFEPRRLLHDFGPWLVFNAALAAGFLAVYFISIRPQSDHDLEQMREIWVDAFPPVTTPAAMPLWLLKSHTGALLAYPFGGVNYGSTLSFLLCVAGVIVLARHRQWLLLLLLLGPLAPTFAAAALERYPYGVMVRFNIYIGPAVCLLVGWGMAAIARAWSSRPATRLSTRAAWGFVVFLVVVGTGSMAIDIALPAKTTVDQRFRDFSRWFWFEMEEEAELVCMKTDLGLDFAPGTYVYGFSSMYLCNQAIYSRRHARGEAPRWDRVSADRPLRCVQFTEDRYPVDQAALERWLDEMSEHYVLVGRARYPVRFYDKRDSDIRATAEIETFDFIPRDPERVVPAVVIRPPEALWR